jgi:hypothetical protein
MRCVVVALVAVTAMLAFASIAQAQDQGAEVRSCTIFDPELVGVAVTTPSDHRNGNCGPPGPAEVQGGGHDGSGHGALAGRCSDINPEFSSGHFVLPPSGHETGNCA